MVYESRGSVIKYEIDFKAKDFVAGLSIDFACGASELYIRAIAVNCLNALLYVLGQYRSQPL